MIQAVRYIFFLGSHPELSRLEITTVLRREGLAYEIVTDTPRYLVVALDRELPKEWLARLGGVDRIARVLETANRPWDAATIANVLSPLGPHARKVVFGFSALGMPKDYAKVTAHALKKQLREQKIRMSFVLPRGTSPLLNAAQVIFNKLTVAPNAEMVVVREGEEYHLARTEHIQDIQAYEVRDTGRPARDARVGMLSPKLAQIMLNIIPSFAGAQPVVLDPFCGTGTILQEGWLLGWRTVGSDASERMIAMAERNLDWLAERADVETELRPPLDRHDVQQSFRREAHGTVDAIVTEPFLGEALSTPLSPDAIAQRYDGLAGLYLAAFTNFRPVLKAGGWVVFMLPAYRTSKAGDQRFVRFPAAFIDDVERLGYSFEHLGDDGRGLLYARPDALVAREITLWRG